MAIREDAPSMFSMLASVDWPSLDTDKAKAMAEMMERAEDRQARKDYFAAISQFQGRCPIIEKGDKANGRPYARMDRIWRTIKPLMFELGLAPSWHVVEYRESGNTCHLEGELTHTSGHFVKLIHDVPCPEKIPGQSSTQRAGSAETFAKRYATCSALGIVTGEDDDGTGGAPGHEVVSREQGNKIMDALGKFPFPDDEQKELLNWQGVKSVDGIHLDQFDVVMSELRRRYMDLKKKDAE